MNTNDTLFNARGYFGPDSQTWRIYREPTFLFGSIRALLLQIAHPAVAEGVARFSNFEKDAFGRGQRTFIAMTWLYFGSRQEAEQSAQKMNRMHRPIKGEYPTKSGTVAPTSKPYFANDPALKLWVLATLVDTTLLMYETFYRPLTAAEKTVFYEESKAAAQLLGIPMEVYPADYQAFRQYFDGMMLEGSLDIGESGRRVCHAILHHKYAPKRLSRVLAMRFLPGHLSSAFGLKKKSGDDLMFKVLAWAARLYFRLMPGYLRFVPAWHQGVSRVKKVAGQRRSLLGWCYDALGKRIDLPFGIPAQWK